MLGNVGQASMHHREATRGACFCCCAICILCAQNREWLLVLCFNAAMLTRGGRIRFWEIRGGYITPQSAWDLAAWHKSFSVGERRVA